MPPVDEANQAIEAAQRFLLAQNPIRGRVAKVIKASLDDNVWVIKFNLGIVKRIIATIKLKASTGDIIDFDVPAFEI